MENPLRTLKLQFLAFQQKAPSTVEKQGGPFKQKSPVNDQAFLNHILLYCLTNKNKKKPSYLVEFSNGMQSTLPGCTSTFSEAGPPQKFALQSFVGRRRNDEMV
ncbi:hypothetical protein B5G03_11515 [Gemmiger sp. An50]|nr:hypothetical protein B5G03_11515 [Gemmiger sp. An50]